MSTAIHAGIKVDPVLFTDHAYTLLRSGDLNEKYQAASALYAMSLPSIGEWYKAINAFLKTVEEECAENLRHSLLRTVLSWFKTAPRELLQPIHNLVEKVWRPVSSSNIEELTRVLAFDFEHLGVQLRDSLLSMLQAADIEHAHINILDLALKRFVTAGDVLLVRSFLEDLLLRPDKNFHLASFDSVVRCVREEAPDQMDAWSVAWLRSGNYQLCEELKHGLFSGSEHQYTFDIDFSSYNLADREYGFIARKSIAAFFLKPKTIASMIVSLSRRAKPAVREELQELLFSPVLINYPSLADDLLTAMAADERELSSAFIRGALEKLEHYLGGLKRARNVPELRPSEREQQLEWQRHTDEMNDAMRGAQRGSFLAEIVTEKILLHGNGMVTWVPDFPGRDIDDEVPPKSRRIETALASFTHSMAIPRQQLLDPVGLDRMLMSFIMERSPV